MLFAGFSQYAVRVKDIEIFVTIGGRGEPVLLLHGYPETHACWHKIAGQLAKDYTVVCSDLRGYGASSKPQDTAQHSYSKRTMALDQVQLMEQLGFRRFSVVGHDRGARVAYRMALDHPERVQKLVVLDIIPTLDTWKNIDWRVGLSTYHWFFLAQPDGLPEQLIGAAPEQFLRHTLKSWCKTPGALSREVVDEYVHWFCQPPTISATCADYRAGATVDIQHDAADRAMKRLIRCPVLVLWGELEHARWDYLSIWQTWATQVQGYGLPSGHFLPEEAPEDVLAALREFL